MFNVFIKKNILLVFYFVSYTAEGGAYMLKSDNTLELFRIRRSVDEDDGPMCV